MDNDFAKLANFCAVASVHDCGSSVFVNYCWTVDYIATLK
jgi:hypothetical protein